MARPPAGRAAAWSQHCKGENGKAESLTDLYYRKCLTFSDKPVLAPPSEEPSKNYFFLEMTSRPPRYFWSTSGTLMLPSFS